MKCGSYKTAAGYYQPVIIEKGRRVILWGDPLMNRETARKYAQLEINARRKMARP